MYCPTHRRSVSVLLQRSLHAGMLAAIAGGLAVTALVQAANWPEFRGPTGQGHATAQNLPTEWSDTQNVVWKQPLPGEGWSSPALVDGRLYLTAAIPVENGKEGDRSLSLLILDAQSGRLLRRVDVFQQDGATAPKIHSKNSHASPTPLVDGDQVFVHFGHQGTACLNRAGDIQWTNRDLQYSPVHGNGGSPILVDERLIFSCDGSREPFVVALDRRSGKVLWKTMRQADADRKFSFSTPLLITVDGQRQIISPGSNGVVAYDPQDGSEIWHVTYDGYSVIPRPIYGHGLIYISTGYNTPSVLAIRPDGQGDVTESHVAWTFKRGAPHTPSLLLVGDELYMVSDRGVATCLDAKTGEEVWQERLGGAFSASPIYADGKIYMQSEEGVGFVLRPGREFDLVAENKLGERTLASYAVDNGRLYIRSAEHLFCVSGQ